MQEFTLRTTQRSQMLDITDQLQQMVRDSGIQEGILHVHIPHTTAGITINENADPDVVADLLGALERLVPWRAGYAHSEGNSAAHIKASLMGFGVEVIIAGGRLQLGTWQGIYFCEFDGARSRKVWIQITPSHPV